MSEHSIPTDMLPPRCDWQIPDPGNAGTIVIDKNFGFVRLVSAAAETRTLPVPSHANLWVTLFFAEDGGDITLTVTSGLVGSAASGSNFVKAFTDVGQFLTLQSVAISDTAFRWRAVSGNLNAAKAFINVPIMSAVEADGTPLVAFADGASPTPGWSPASVGVGVRWNNHADPDPIMLSFPIPADAIETEPLKVYILAAKVGATLADAVTFAVGLVETVVGQSITVGGGADGGTTDAMDGDAASLTVQRVSFTLSAAEFVDPTSGGVIHLTIEPTAGTLGTDDVIICGVYVEYHSVKA